MPVMEHAWVRFKFKLKDKADDRMLHKKRMEFCSFKCLIVWEMAKIFKTSFVTHHNLIFPSNLKSNYFLRLLQENKTTRSFFSLPKNIKKREAPLVVFIPFTLSTLFLNENGHCNSSITVRKALSLPILLVYKSWEKIFN